MVKNIGYSFPCVCKCVALATHLTHNRSFWRQVFPHTPETQNRNRKESALANRKIYTLILYAFYDLRPGNGTGPIITVPEPTTGYHVYVYTLSK